MQYSCEYVLVLNEKYTHKLCKLVQFKVLIAKAKDETKQYKNIQQLWYNAGADNEHYF